MTTSFRCACGHDQEIQFEVEPGCYKISEIWTEDGELNCQVCGTALDPSAVYTAVSIDHVSDMTDAASDYEPYDR